MDIPTRSGMAWLDNSAGLGLKMSDTILVVMGITQMRLKLLVVLHEKSTYAMNTHMLNVNDFRRIRDK